MTTNIFGAGKTISITFYSFITRNKQHRVGVDAYNVLEENNDQYLCEYNLNVSHRTTFDDVEKHKIQG